MDRRGPLIIVSPDRDFPEDHVITQDQLPKVAASGSFLPLHFGEDRYFLFNMTALQAESLLHQPDPRRRWPTHWVEEYPPTTPGWYTFPTHQDTSLHPLEVARASLTTGVYEREGYIHGYLENGRCYVDAYTQGGMQIPFGKFDEQGTMVAGFRVVYPSGTTIDRPDVHPTTPPINGGKIEPKRQIVHPNQFPFHAYLDQNDNVTEQLRRYPPMLEISQVVNGIRDRDRIGSSEDLGVLRYILSLMTPLSKVIQKNSAIFFNTMGTDSASLAFATRVEIADFVLKYLLKDANRRSPVRFSSIELGTPAYDFQRPGHANPEDQLQREGVVYPRLITITSDRS